MQKYFWGYKAKKGVNMQMLQKNNSLFESKHYYLKLLQSIESIKRKLEYQFLSTDAGSKQLEEVKQAWIEAFLGLLEEGLEFNYIKCPENPQKDIVRITIENINYDCFVADLREVAKNYSYINPNVAEIIQEKIDANTKNQTDQEVNVPTASMPTNEVMNEVYKERDAEPELNEPDKMNETTENEKLTTKKEELPQINKKDIDAFSEVTNDSKISATIEPEQSIEKVNETLLFESIEDTPKEALAEEKAKEHKTFVYDEIKVEIYEMGAAIGEKFHLWIMPIEMAEDELHAKIVVAAANSKGEMRYFASEKIATVIADLWGYEILVRGMFKKGNFESYVILAGNAAASNCSMNKQVIEHRSENKSKTHWGHIFFDEKGKKVHVIPFDKEGKDRETDPAGLIVTIETENKYQVFANPFVDEVIAPLENEVLHLNGYWMDDKLIVDTF